MKKSNIGNDRGFTLIELLIVIAIIGFLAAAILVAVDPVKRIEQSRNAKRWSEVNAVLNAILTKQVDDRAAFGGTASAPIFANATNVQVIVSDITGINCTVPATRPTCGAKTTINTSATSCVADLNGLVGDGTTDSYIAAIPVDPRGAGYEPAVGVPVIGDANTGYYIQKFPNGRIEIGGCWSDNAEAISIKR